MSPSLFNSLRTWTLLAALGCLPLKAQALLSLPLVDVSSHVTGTSVSVAIWSGTDVTLSAGTSLVLGFPSDWTVPAFNPATCGCVFIKHTLTGTAGTFTASEVTITAGSLVGQNITVTLPVAIAPGPFYARIDDFAGIKLPTTAGTSTLTLAAGSVKVMSQPVVAGTGVESTPGELNGIACLAVSPTCMPVKGALVIASTDSSVLTAAPVLEMGPASGTISAKANADETLMTVTGMDGRFSLKTPFVGTSTYYVAVFYGTSATAGTSVNRKSATSTVTVSSSATQSFTFTSFVNCSSN